MMKRLSTIITFCSLINALSAAPKMPLSTSYWKSSGFLKEFNGSYRINANIEPILSSEERGELVAIQSLMAQGERKAVISKLKSSSRLKSSPALQFNLANVLSENGDTKDAITYYKKAINSLPAFRRAHQNLAYIYVKSNQLDEAFPHLLEVIKLGGNDGSVHGLLAHCFQQQEQYEPALLSFRQALAAQPNAHDWKIGVAHCLHQLDRTEEALKQYSTLLKNRDTDNSAIELQLAYLHIEIGNPEKAITYLEILRRKEKLDNEQEILLGTLLLNTGNINIGAQTLKRTIDKPEFDKPTSALSAVRHCISLSLTKLAEELHQKIKYEALKEPTQQSNYQRLKAQLIFIKQPFAKEGIQIIKELIEQNPTDSQSLLILGQQYAKAGQHHEAVIIFDQAVNAADSHSLAAQLEKAQSLVKLGDHTKAVVTLKEYLKTNDEQNVRDYLSAIEAIVEAKGE